jgi:hypothetical protein
MAKKSNTPKQPEFPYEIVVRYEDDGEGNFYFVTGKDEEDVGVDGSNKPTRIARYELIDENEFVQKIVRV